VAVGTAHTAAPSRLRLVTVVATRQTLDGTDGKVLAHGAGLAPGRPGGGGARARGTGPAGRLARCVLVLAKGARHARVGGHVQVLALGAGLAVRGACAPGRLGVGSRVARLALLAAALVLVGSRGARCTLGYVRPEVLARNTRGCCEDVCVYVLKVVLYMNTRI
jgi:hypothetical protein